MDRRQFIQAGLTLSVLGDRLAASPDPEPRIALSERFPRRQAPETGRRVVQLTSGPAQCYPLYYYVPSITSDGRYLIYHRAADGQLQLYRLELATGESTQLTRATCEDTQWRPWCIDSGTGVLDHRSSLSVTRGAVVYFDGRQGRQVDVETLRDELLFEIPADREAYGRTACTPDGQWLIYIHVPRGSMWGNPCEGAAVAAYHFESREHRTLCRIDSSVFHVASYDDRHFVVTHPADGPGMLMTDLTSGSWRTLRDGVVHCPCTRRGIAYEVPSERRLGLLDPLTMRRFEYRMPEQFQYVHTGRDPEGRIFFYENSTDWDRFDTHDMYALVRLDPQRGEHHWLRLIGNWPTFLGGQKAHFHPQITPDRQWILFSGGDAETETCHIFLLDISDLQDSEGIGPEEMVSGTVLPAD